MEIEMNENDKIFTVADRFVWAGCPFPRGFATRELAVEARTLFQTINRSTPKRDAKRIFDQIDELGRRNS